jgi:hypothetical protein
MIDGGGALSMSVDTPQPFCGADIVSDSRNVPVGLANAKECDALLRMLAEADADT